MFQAVRSPGNINYKRKEQWKTFHPRIPCPLEPRRRHCLRCTPIFVSTTVQGQHVFDGDEENSQTGVSCLSACEMKEEEKRSLGKMEERRGCSRSGQPTVTETVRRRPTLFSRYTCRILNRDYHFRQLSFEISLPILLHSYISYILPCSLLFSLYLSPSRRTRICTRASPSSPFVAQPRTKRAVFETFLKYPSLFHAFESSRMRIRPPRFLWIPSSCSTFPRSTSSPFVPFESLSPSLSLPFQTEVDRGEKEETRSRQGKRTDKRWINSSNHANPSIPVINRAHENARKRDSRHPCPFVLS